MQIRVFLGAVAVCLGLVGSSVAQSAASPEGTITSIVRVFLAPNYDTDWSGLEKLPGIKWAPLPPKMLDNCLPDGGCFTRAGTANLGGQNLSVLATGARTIVTHVYLRNGGAAIGEPRVVAALKQAGFSEELARCPVPGTIGGTNWYRLKSAGSGPGFIAIQSSCNGKPCEGFTLTMGTDLPAAAAKSVEALLGAVLSECFGAQGRVDIIAPGRSGADDCRLHPAGIWSGVLRLEGVGGSLPQSRVDSRRTEEI